MQPIVLLLPQSQLPAFSAAISSAVGRRPFTSVCTSFSRSALKFWMPAWSNGHILIVSSSLLTRVASCELILVSGWGTSFRVFPAWKKERVLFISAMTSSPQSPSWDHHQPWQTSLVLVQNEVRTLGRMGEDEETEDVELLGLTGTEPEVQLSFSVAKSF